MTTTENQTAYKMQNQLQQIAELESDCEDWRRELNDLAAAGLENCDGAMRVKCSAALAKLADAPHTGSIASTEAHRRTVR